MTNIAQRKEKVNKESHEVLFIPSFETKIVGSYKIKYHAITLNKLKH